MTAIYDVSGISCYFWVIGTISLIVIFFFLLNILLNKINNGKEIIKSYLKNNLTNNLTNRDIKKGLLIFLLIFSVLFFYGIVFDKLTGDYRIDSYWIGNDSNGVKYCNNCLWIKFDEGCNRYKTYYFENQHELDKRLEVGMPVDIYFTKQGTIRNVEPRIKYYDKCS